MSSKFAGEIRLVDDLTHPQLSATSAIEHIKGDILDSEQTSSCCSTVDTYKAYVKFIRQCNGDVFAVCDAGISLYTPHELDQLLNKIKPLKSCYRGAFAALRQEALGNRRLILAVPA